MIQLRTVLLPAACLFAFAARAQELPLGPAQLNRTEPVDFAREIQPLFQRHCVACHQSQVAEAGLNLETRDGALEGGGSGPGIVPNKPDQSLIMSRVTGREEPLMPPEDNDSGAEPLTAEQLGLLKLWIEQGAPGSEMSETPSIDWQRLPDIVQPVYALAASPVGNWFAAGRGSQVAIYDATSGEELGSIVDPQMQSTIGTSAAHADIVQSIAIAPSGELVATGGYRTVKIWRRSSPAVTADDSPLRFAVKSATLAPDQECAALINAIGEIEIWDLRDASLLAKLRGHTAPVVGMQWTNRGERLISADASGRVISWNAAGTEEFATETGRNLTVFSATADGQRVAAIDLSRRVHQWKIVTDGAKQTRLEPVEAAALDDLTDATSLAISRDARGPLFIASASGEIRCVDVDDGSLLRTIGHAGVTTLACSPDGSLLLTAGTDGAPRLWNTANGEQIAALAEDPRHEHLLSAAVRRVERQKAVVAREIAQQESLAKQLEAEQEAAAKMQTELEQATESAEAAKKTFADLNAQLKDLNAEVTELEAKLAERKKKTEATAEEVNKAEAAREEAANNTLDDLNAQLNEMNTELTELEAKLAERKKSAEATAEEVKKAETARKEAAEKEAEQQADRGRATEMVERAERAVEQQRKRLEAAQRSGQRYEHSLATVERSVAEKPRPVVAHFCATGETVAIAHDDSSVRVYAAPSGRLLNVLNCNALPAALCDVPGKEAFAVLFADDPAAFAAQRAEWVLEQQIGSLDDSPISDRVTAIDFHPDGNAIAVGSGPPSRGGEISIFDTAGGRLLQSYPEAHSDTVLALRFRRDGLRLASSSADNTIKVFDVSAADVLRTLEGHTHHVLAIAWKDDGSQIASASADQTIKIWNPETGEQSRTISGFGKEVTGLTYVGASEQLAAAAADGKVRIYDVTNGRAQRTIDAAGDVLYALSLMPDEKHVIAGGHSGTVRVWTLDEGKQVHELR